MRKHIVLASGSPRRRELLSMLGLSFRVLTGDYEEEMGLALHPRRLARHLSLRKAESVARRCGDAVVIAADTFILFRGELLGKPRNAEEAKTMLRKLSGRRHSVITGYTVLEAAAQKTVSRAVTTTVFFRTITRQEIDAYVATGEPLDKAGAYAIQGLGSVFVRKIEGDYFNVIGLPLCSLTMTLKRFGIPVLRPDK